MSDIAERLRALRGPYLGDGFTKIHRDEILAELDRLREYGLDLATRQAAEIRQLRAAVVALREIVRSEADRWHGYDCVRGHREALRLADEAMVEPEEGKQ